MSQSSPLKRWPQEFLSFLTWCSKKSSWHRSLLSVKKNTLYCLALPPIRALLSFSFTFSLGSSSRYECVRGTGCKDGDYGKQGIKKGNQLGLFSILDLIVPTALRVFVLLGRFPSLVWPSGQYQRIWKKVRPFVLLSGRKLVGLSHHLIWKVRVGKGFCAFFHPNMLEKVKGSHTFRNKTPLYPLRVLPPQLQCMAWLARNFI